MLTVVVSDKPLEDLSIGDESTTLSRNWWTNGKRNGKARAPRFEMVGGGRGTRLDQSRNRKPGSKRNRRLHAG